MRNTLRRRTIYVLTQNGRHMAPVVVPGERMSIKVPSICLVDGCPARETREGRCDVHQRKPWAQRSPSSEALASNPAHRRERIRAARRAKGRCEHCGRPHHDGEPPFQLHHPHPIGQGGAVVQADARLLCTPCHRRADRKAGARR